MRCRCVFDPLRTREINVLRGLLGFEKYLRRPTHSPSPGRLDTLTDMSAITVADVMAALERRYPSALALDWDNVGLQVGDPDAPVARILWAVDATDEVLNEAESLGAELVITHHPLLFRPPSTVTPATRVGRRVLRLARGGRALISVHTNADAATPGVSDALADALGLCHLRPLRPHGARSVDKLTYFVPREHHESVLAAVLSTGAGSIGSYDWCAFTSEGTGQFRPLPGAHPTLGSIGAVEHVAEYRVEVIVPAALRESVVATLIEAHPYEEVAYDVVATYDRATDTGIGRVGVVEPTRLGDLASRLSAALPATPRGLQLAGDPDVMVTTVAVCGGAGDDLLADARTAGAQVYVTSDLRHHVTQDHLADGGTAVIDIPHWAGEWLWLPTAAEALAADLAPRTLAMTVSTRVTDPWTHHLPSGGSL